MPSFICRSLVGDDIELYGGGIQVSDCVYVEDVANTFVAALNYTRRHDPDTFEVGPAISHTVLETAKEVIRQTAPMAMGLSKLVELPMRPGEVPGASVTSDNSKLAKLGIDVRDFVTLEDGIRRTATYYHDVWLPEYLQSVNL